MRVLPTYFFGLLLFDETGLQDHTWDDFITVVLLLATGTSLFVFAVSAIVGTAYLTNFVATFATLLFILYSGVFVQNSSKPDIEWMDFPKHASFYNYAFEILMVNEFENLTFRISNTTVSVGGLGTIDTSDFEVFIPGEFFTTNFWGFNPDNIDYDFEMLWTLSFICLAFTWAGLTFLHRTK